MPSIPVSWNPDHSPISPVRTVLPSFTGEDVENGENKKFMHGVTQPRGGWDQDVSKGAGA